MTRLVKACPRCDVADIQTTAPSIQEQGAAAHGYRCNNCRHRFDDPVERPAKSKGGLQGLAFDLDRMDPDDVTAPRGGGEA